MPDLRQMQNVFTEDPKEKMINYYYLKQKQSLILLILHSANSTEAENGGRKRTCLIF